MLHCGKPSLAHQHSKTFPAVNQYSGKAAFETHKTHCTSLFSHKQLMSDDGFAGTIRIKGENEIYEREDM
jgi:hypothetical protein